MIAFVTFVLTLSVLVLVHEWGHFAAARRAGVLVHEFGFGFPPRLLAFRRGDTVYSINLVPFGGFVKLEGENDDSAGPASFKSKRVGTRAWILASGVLMNLMAAVVLFSITLSLGVPTELDPTAIPKNTKNMHVAVAEVSAESPAATIGLRVGDGIYAVDGQPLKSVDQLRSILGDNPTSPHDLIVRSGRVTRSVPVTASPGPDGIPRIGIAGVSVGTVVTPFPRSVPAAFVLTGRLSWTVLGSLGALITDVVSHRAISGDVTGPIGIAVLSGRVAAAGFVSVLQFIGVLSVSLAILNALPIPALDGGRLFFAAVEAIRRRPVNPNVERAVHTVGFYALLLLVLVVSVKDFRQFQIFDAVKRLLP